MAALSDSELVELIAVSLHRSGPDGNAERLGMEFARIRAAIVVRALHGAGVIVIREERRGRRQMDVDMVMEDAGGHYSRCELTNGDDSIDF